MGERVATLPEVYAMRAEMLAWLAHFRARGADRSLPTLERYGAVVMAEQAEDSLLDCEELIRRLRGGR